MSFVKCVSGRSWVVEIRGRNGARMGGNEGIDSCSVIRGVHEAAGREPGE